MSIESNGNIDSKLRSAIKEVVVALENKLEASVKSIDFITKCTARSSTLEAAVIDTGLYVCGPCVYASVLKEAETVLLFC